MARSSHKHGARQPWNNSFRDEESALAQTAGMSGSLKYVRGTHRRRSRDSDLACSPSSGAGNSGAPARRGARAQRRYAAARLRPQKYEALLAAKQCAMLLKISSNTGWVSATELLITLRISAEAFCCSSPPGFR